MNEEISKRNELFYKMLALYYGNQAYHPLEVVTAAEMVIASCLANLSVAGMDISQSTYDSIAEDIKSCTAHVLTQYRKEELAKDKL